MGQLHSGDKKRFSAGGPGPTESKSGNARGVRETGSRSGGDYWPVGRGGGIAVTVVGIN